jgi:hypothetical protein
MQRLSLQRGLGLTRAVYRPGICRSFTQTQLRLNATNTPINNTNTGAEHRPRRSVIGTTLAVAKWTGLLMGSAGVGIILIGAVVFVHDAFTYSEKHLDRVPVSPLALNPKLGGPKSLPIAEVNLDDEENEGELRPDGCMRFRHLPVAIYISCEMLKRRFRMCQTCFKT